MEQLSIKTQVALNEAGFAAAITPAGDVEFRHDTEGRAITVLPVGPEVHVTVKSRAGVSHKNYNAALLDSFTEDALEVLFQTIVDFA